MKKLILVFSALLMINIVFAQADFKWEKIDSISKTKSQIYSDTKMFIAKTWTSAKDVIQNDDKDLGVILIKGKSVQAFMVSMGMCPMEYIYDYNITFRMKENKYKITVDNVVCVSAHGGTSYQSVRPIEPSGEIPYPYKAGSLSRTRATEMMQSLRAELQSILDSYEISMKSTVSAGSSNDNW